MKDDTSQGQPLLEALVQLFPDCTKNTLRSWLKQGRIQVDGRIVKTGNTFVMSEQCITLGTRKKFVSNGLYILYQDPHLIVIEKPRELLSVASDHETSDTAHGLLKKYCYPRRVSVVHRLDCGTSGVMLFALNSLALKGLKETFKNHDIERVYIAIVEGEVKEQEGIWRHLLYEDANYVMKTTTNSCLGSWAITHYRVLQRCSQYSRLLCRLETGKKNQIRVQSAKEGYPIAGDKKYGARTNPIGRLCLHAKLLEFRHPVTNKMMKFEVPEPEEFFSVIDP